jgi:hypothetical protein
MELQDDRTECSWVTKKQTPTANLLLLFVVGCCCGNLNDNKEGNDNNDVYNQYQ